MPITAELAYEFDEHNRFVVHNYNWAKPFSNFLPGVAGKWGVPLWAYYVNRNQGICSLGLRDKNHAILEFLSFNKACQVVGHQGFRTFVRGAGSGLYEPFQKRADPSISQSMIVSAHELEIRELNPGMGLAFSVAYFTLPGLPLAVFVRQLTITNTGKRTRELDLYDGVARLLPYGTTFEHAKMIARHTEGMMAVYDLHGIPLYKLKQTPADIEEVGDLKGGNFYFSFLEPGQLLSSSLIVDPYLVFHDVESCDYPWGIEKTCLDTTLGFSQVRENRTPCAFTALPLKLSQGQQMLLTSLIGYTPDEASLNNLRVELDRPHFIAEKREENKNIIDGIQNATFTASNHPLFDRYCQQTFLDNVLRGGMPLIFESESGKRTFHIFWRQNGDLERDYHWFDLAPTYLSQGTSHYRNLNQNRRMDNWFYPEIDDGNIRLLMGLIQTDGYNPLEVRGMNYIAQNAQEVDNWLRDLGLGERVRNELNSMVSRPFSPGGFIMALQNKTNALDRSYDAILAGLLPLCRECEVGGIHEGYWIDHWHYNLDLIEAYLAIYPDRLKDLLVGERVYTFYDNPDIVRPRDQKIVLTAIGVRQYNSVFRDLEKERISQPSGAHMSRVKTGYGNGHIYRTYLLVKLLCILSNKIGCLDPEGVGIEMEADKPGWCDSLNGLPGLLGSSSCEMLELIRLCRWLKTALSGTSFSGLETLPIYEELFAFVTGLLHVVRKRMHSKGSDRALAFWQDSHELMEKYRATTRLGISGREKAMSMESILNFVEACLQLLETNLTENTHKLIDPQTGIPYTYFVNEVIEWRHLPDAKGDLPRPKSHDYPAVQPRRFKQRPLALFLEGPVHYLRVYREHAERLYERVRAGGLFDPTLKMYKCCQSLANETFEVGRIKAYPQGWLENESIYTHMEFKWLIEILRCGLYEQFFEDFINCLPPYLDPQYYGRSTVEGSSFIVSSCFPDARLHGQAFQPRLSGATNEMLQIWTLMVAGERPFLLNEHNRLVLRFQPSLPGWLFTQEEQMRRYNDPIDGWLDVQIPENSFAFKFLNRTLVIYRNPNRKHTYGKGRACIHRFTLHSRDGSHRSVPSDHLDHSNAIAVRQGTVKRIDVMLL